MTRGKDGKQQTVEVSTQGNGTPVNAHIQEMPADNVKQSTMNNGNLQTQTTHSPPHTTNMAPQRNSNMPPPQQQRVSPEMQPNRGPAPLRSPDVPTRHPHRVSREMENPVSPVDGRSGANNFSYPSRSTLRDTDNDTINSKPSGRMDNLKAAAVGLHVGSPQLTKTKAVATDMINRAWVRLSEERSIAKSTIASHAATRTRRLP